MTENSFKNHNGKNKASSGYFLKNLQSIINGSFLTRNRIVNMLPFFFYLMLLALTLIFNSYYAERKVQQKEELRNEITELRIRYITTKSELMFMTNQSEIARKLEERGLVESTVPPRIVEKPKKKGNFLLNIFDRSSR